MDLNMTTFGSISSPPLGLPVYDFRYVQEGTWVVMPVCPTMVNETLRQAQIDHIMMVAKEKGLELETQEIIDTKKNQYVCWRVKFVSKKAGASNAPDVQKQTDN